MSTLRFPTRPSDEASTEFYELKCIVPSSDATAKFEVRDAKLIHCANSTVYRGTLVGDGKSRDVVCKLVTTKRRMKRVITEAGFYSNEFKKLQGVTVPRFHGLFMGEMMDEEDTACLVLDYIGESLSRCLWTMNAEFRHAALKTLRSIHRAGVQHNDFAERNIVVDENYRPFIIDFEIAVRHKCGQVVPVIFNTKEPTCDEFGCEEMHDSCLIADVWQLRHVKFMHRYVPAEWATTPDELAMRAPPGFSYEEAYASALDGIRELQKWYDDRALFDSLAVGEPLPASRRR